MQDRSKKPWCKISYTLFKEQYGYDPLLYIYPFPTLNQLKVFIGGIQHFVTVVGEWGFDSNFTFTLPLTCDNLDYCYTHDKETKIINGYKGILKFIRFVPTD